MTFWRISSSWNSWFIPWSLWSSSITLFFFYVSHGMYKSIFKKYFFSKSKWLYWLYLFYSLWKHCFENKNIQRYQIPDWPKIKISWHFWIFFDFFKSQIVSNSANINKVKCFINGGMKNRNYFENLTQKVKLYIPWDT